jgi:hypothetical protein
MSQQLKAFKPDTNYKQLIGTWTMEGKMAYSPVFDMVTIKKEISEPVYTVFDEMFYYAYRISPSAG